MSASPAHVKKASHHDLEQPGAWLPRSSRKAPVEEYATVTALEDRFHLQGLPLWDWDYLQRPAVQRPSELWTDLWSEWPDNLEAD